LEELEGESRLKNPFFPEIPYSLDKELRYLVIDPKYSIHPWRFSINTTLALNSFGFNVTYASMRELDPQVSLLRFRVLLRSLKTKKERHKFGDQLLAEKGIKSLIFSKRYSFFLLKNATNLLFGRTLNVSPSLNLALNSYLSTKFGSTKFNYNFSARITAARVAFRYHMTYQALKSNKIQNNFDFIFTFNGRFPVDSAIVAFCKDFGMQRILFDGGAISDDNYNKMQFFSTSPHNPTEVKEKIQHYWGSGEDSKRDIGIRNIKSLMKGSRFLGSSFNWEKADTLLTNNSRLVGLEETIVFFASSDWEQAAVNEWRPEEGFHDQFELLAALNHAAIESNLKILIKPHPIRKNFRKNANDEESALWQNFCERHQIRAEVILSKDNIRAVDLLSRAKIVAGFGTSVLAQSIYAGIPTIVGAREAWINEMNQACLVTNRFEIYDKLKNILVGNALLPDSESVVPWAYYQATNGIELQGIEFTGRKLIYQGEFIDDPNGYFNG
jgi:hypothetical protein